jgi:uncharacterized cupin superfamily protein
MRSSRTATSTCSCSASATGSRPASCRVRAAHSSAATRSRSTTTIRGPSRRRSGCPRASRASGPGTCARSTTRSHYGGVERNLARGIAKRTGLNLFTLPPGTEGAPPHCHSADEELFVVLDGGGTLELWGRPDPAEPRRTAPAEMQPIRAGHVVSRPPGTGVSHCLRAGPDGLTYLAYGTREPNDLVWYPRSNKVFFRGLGVIGRLELLDYSDGEPE